MFNRSPMLRRVDPSSSFSLSAPPLPAFIGAAHHHHHRPHSHYHPHPHAQSLVKGAALRKFLDEVKQWPNLKHSQDLKHFLTTDRCRILKGGKVAQYHERFILLLLFL